jgi:hypothetical protein
MNVAAISDAGQCEAQGERDQLAATGGPEAVADAAWEPGTPSQEEAAEWYRRWMREEGAKGDVTRGEGGLSGARLADAITAGVIAGISVPSAAGGALANVPPLSQIDLPGLRATTTAEVRSAVIPEKSAPRGRSRELRDITRPRELARLLKAARRWLRPRDRHTPPPGFRMAFMLPETPSPAEMTIIETPFRIPRYMDHPEWRPS